MLKISSQTKIFVPAPAGTVTGGAELLHQLVGYLRDHGRDAYIVYFGEAEHSIPTDYGCYNIATSNQVEDIGTNVVVIYEGIYNQIALYPNAQKVLWWLSVDNFFLCSRSFLSPFDYYRYQKHGLRRIAKLCLHFLMGRNEFNELLSIKELVSLNAVNAYQSEYAQWWLLKHHFPNVVPLKDYINIDHCKSFSIEGREDIVLYNPKKGFSFTQKLIALSPDIKWVALQGMSRTQLIEILGKAKVYVDFGYHPGKDRLPRECAMNWCCVITGKRGSARFFEDVSVPDEYKFDEKTARLEDIIERIRWTLAHYDKAIADFSYYRASIAQEKKEFELQICKLFEISEEV